MNSNVELFGIILDIHILVWGITSRSVRYQKEVPNMYRTSMLGGGGPLPGPEGVRRDMLPSFAFAWLFELAHGLNGRMNELCDWSCESLVIFNDRICDVV